MSATLMIPRPMSQVIHSPASAVCPSWCARHSDQIGDDPLVHTSRQEELTAKCLVCDHPDQLRSVMDVTTERVDWPGEPAGEPVILLALDHGEMLLGMTPDEAWEMAKALARHAAAATRQ